MVALAPPAPYGSHGPQACKLQALQGFSEPWRPMGKNTSLLSVHW
jgi:hypothetical protein